MIQNQLLLLHTHALYKCSTCVRLFCYSCRDPLWYQGLSPPLERIVSLGAVWGETASGDSEASAVQSDQRQDSRRQGISELISIKYLLHDTRHHDILKNACVRI